jgi:hypothetical protein
MTTNEYDAIVVGGGHDGPVSPPSLAGAADGVCGILGLQAARAALKDARAERRSPRRLLAGRGR